MDKYQKLESIFTQLYWYGSISSLLEWDKGTYMPKGAGELRGGQMGFLAGKMQDIMNDQDLPKLVEDAEAQPGLDNWQKANVREIKHILLHRFGMDTALATRLEEVQSQSYVVWEKAKKENSFKDWLPYFEQVVRLTREVADFKSQKMGLDLYDCLLDEYQPGIIQKHIDQVFSVLESELPKIVAEITGKQGPAAQLSQEYAQDKQETLHKQLAELVGFDMSRGRIDTTAHGFCAGSGDDVRIAYTPLPNSPMKTIMTIMHEAGHALYEQNLPRQHMTQPVGAPLGMAAHESQSIFWERQICGSKQFLPFLAQKMRELFGYDEITPETITAIVGQIRPSFVRVDADEVTYPLHVILRYNLEKALIAGDLQPKDVPAAWNEGMHKTLGITPPTDTLGCLQDVHWAGGMIGYFPSYSLGAIAAAQLAAAMKEQIQDFDKKVANADFADIRNWLITNIHSKGSFIKFQDLLKSLTGSQLSADCFITHLRARYL